MCAGGCGEPAGPGVQMPPRENRVPALLCVPGTELGEARHRGGSSMVINSPVSTTCTWQSLWPFSCQMPITRHFCGPLPSSFTMRKISLVQQSEQVGAGPVWVKLKLAAASKITREIFHFDQTM